MYIQVVRRDLKPVAITAGIGKTAAKTASSVQLRRRALFKLQVTLARSPATQQMPGRLLLPLSSSSLSKTALAPINPVDYMLRVDVPGAGGVGKKDAGAMTSFFRLVRTIVSPGAAANGTWTTATKKRHAALPPTNITSVGAEGIKRLEWWPVAVSQYPAGSALSCRRTLTMTMRVGKAAPVGGPLAFNISVAQILPLDLSVLGTMHLVTPPVQVTIVGKALH